MTSQIFKKEMDNSIIFNLLDKLCDKNNTYYTFNNSSYKKGTFFQDTIQLFLKEIKENGISIFMKKLGNGMTGYFNLKHKEVGRLFQGPYKSKIIDEENYFKYLSVYIQVKNVFELYPGGYEKAVQEFDSAYEWAINYPYCSLADYASDRNSPIIEKDVLGELFNDPKEYKEFARQCLEKMNLDEKLEKLRID